MKKMFILLLMVCVLLFVNCKTGNNSSDMEEKLIGRWEQDVPATRGSTETFEITAEGDEYLVDSYVAYKKDTKYEKSNGDILLMKAGSTDSHKKSKLVYDQQTKLYQLNKKGFLVDINIIDHDHLELKLPGQTQVYNRVK